VAAVPLCAEALGLEFLQILVFILIIAALVQLVEFYLKKSAPALYKSMGIYLALITTNCAILAVTFDNISKGYNFAESLVYAFGVASGFMLSLLLLAGVRNRIKTSPIPAFLKGTPILFVATSLLSMAFMGFPVSLNRECCHEYSIDNCHFCLILAFTVGLLLGFLRKFLR